MTFPTLPMPEILTDPPRWAVLAAIGLTVVALPAWYLRSLRTRGSVRLAPAKTPTQSAFREAMGAAGPFAFLGTCGMLLSLHGLYGFAVEGMALEWFWALPLMAIFDVAELACFVALYRASLTEATWTKAMRRTRRMAWMLAAASSAMNAAHAPGNAISMVVFALVPLVSLKLIEFELESQLAVNADDDKGAPPGLMRLAELYYERVWAQMFARLGFDPFGQSGVVHADARLRLAALRLRDLRRAIDAEAAAPNTGRRAKRAKEKAQARTSAAQDRAELAIDIAGIAGDAPAQLTLARHLVTRGYVPKLATMDVQDPAAIVGLLEKLAIVPSAEALAAGTRAVQAEKQRQEAEAARDRAVADQKNAEDRAATVVAEAAVKLHEAQQVRTAAENLAASMRKKADEAVAEADAAATRAAAEDEKYSRLMGEVSQLSERARGLRTHTDSTESERQAAAVELEELRKQAQAAAESAQGHRDDAEKALTEAHQARQARRAALGETEATKTLLSELTHRIEQARGQAQHYAGESAKHADELRRLTDAKAAAEAAAATAAEQAQRAQAEADAAVAQRNEATTALQTARLEIMDVLTSPQEQEAPRWTSPAKLRGWDTYLHTVRTKEREPTDAELAGDERDPSTARRWLGEFRAELARRTAAALPAQQDAHGRTADKAPALV